MTAPVARCRSAVLLATASLAALLIQASGAAAFECAGGPPPSNVATPTALYETLRDRTNAQLLAIGLLRKPVAADCAWIYEVKMLTASGSVVELDFAATDLDLVGARGPDDDREVMALVRGFGGDSSTLITGANGGDGSGPGDDSGGDGDDDGGDGDGGDGGDDGGGHSGPGGGGESGGDSDSGSGDGGDD